MQEISSRHVLSPLMKRACFTDEPDQAMRSHMAECLPEIPSSWVRMDPLSRAAVLLVGLAERASGSACPAGSKALIGVTRCGSMDVDLSFWKSMSGGAEEASPQLFVLTLPSIPLSQAAIVHGIEGPVFALIPPEDASAGQGCDAVDEMMDFAQKEAALLMDSDKGIGQVYALAYDLFRREGQGADLSAEALVVAK